ncbi:MAG: InlB B-repeat-containing protein [Acholeplasmatales bacterium]|jgi:uncharacterized repeat protein (TIGR02543 family)|nr:InlB B-repeat-containing protein [Acholeplasmatales bacterium]
MKRLNSVSLALIIAFIVTSVFIAFLVSMSYINNKPTYTLIIHTSSYAEEKISFKGEFDINTLQDNKKEGYEFEGFYLDSKFISKVNQFVITGSADIYAKYTLIPYTIFLNTNGGVMLSSNVISYNFESDTIELPTYVYKDGYTFVGWYQNYVSSNEFGFLVKTIKKGSIGDVSLVARFVQSSLISPVSSTCLNLGGVLV